MQVGSELLSVPVPAGCPPGHALVIDTGDNLRAWENDDNSPCLSCLPDTIRENAAGWGCVLFAVVLIALFAFSLSSSPPPHGQPYQTGRYAGQGQSTYTNSYSRGIDNDRIGGTAGAPASIPSSGPTEYSYESSDDGNSTSISPDSYPGHDEGFERGVDEHGKEIFRYEQDNQVYIIPSDQYYSWRSTYYHGSLTSDILHILLLQHMFSVMMYPRGLYYSTYASGFHPATRPYYASSAYHASYGRPAVGAGGAVSHAPRQAGTSVVRGRPVGSGLAGGTHIAQGRPVSSSHTAAGTPTVSGRPIGTAVGRPVSSSARPTSYTRPSTSTYRRTSFRSFRGRG